MLSVHFDLASKTEPHSPKSKRPSSAPGITSSSVADSTFPRSWHVEQLENVTRSVCASKRCLVVCGAGISVPSGIPDFRSAAGLYAASLDGSADLNAEKDQFSAASAELRGKDMFDISALTDPSRAKIFHKFIANLKSMCDAAKPNGVHRFLRLLDASKQLQRVYTQNIDELETAIGLTNTRDHGPTKGRVVMLHGTLARVICRICGNMNEWTPEHQSIFSQGDAPPCPKCMSFAETRTAAGRRTTRIGEMRPDIVLYNEIHPNGNEIATILSSDLKKVPDVMIVMGTSLKVPGLKQLVRRVATIVRAQPTGRVVFINRTPVTTREWIDVFDFQVLGDAEAICQHLSRALCQRKKSARELAQQWIKEKTLRRVSDFFPVVKSPVKDIVKTMFKEENQKSNCISTLEKNETALEVQIPLSTSKIDAKLNMIKIQRSSKNLVAKTPVVNKENRENTLPKTSKRLQKSKLASLSVVEVAVVAQKSNTYGDVSEEAVKKVANEEYHEDLDSTSFSNTDTLLYYFNLHDHNRDGTLDGHEIRSALMHDSAHGLTLEELNIKVQQVIHDDDADNNGVIDIKEFLSSEEDQ